MDTLRHLRKLSVPFTVKDILPIRFGKTWSRDPIFVAIFAAGSEAFAKGWGQRLWELGPVSVCLSVNATRTAAMVQTCSAYGCKNRYHKDRDISFHKYVLMCARVSDVVRTWWISAVMCSCLAVSGFTSPCLLICLFEASLLPIVNSTCVVELNLRRVICWEIVLVKSSLRQFTKHYLNLTYI